MASNKTEICNMAVSWLGGKRITSVDDDDTLEARLCRANYDLARKAVLEDREWTFAVKRDMFTPLVDPPLFGFSYAFEIPAYVLRVINVYDPGMSNRTHLIGIDHVIEGNKIYANLETIYVRYIEDVEITTFFSALFDQALAAYIAANIAVGLTENQSMQENMHMLYLMKLDAAAASDSLQGTREMLDRSTLERSRRLHVGID